MKLFSLFFDRSWVILAALGSLLGRSWPLFRRSWPLFSRSWAALGRSWAGLGRSWVALGSLLAALGRSWPLLGPLLSRPWLLLGHSWPPLGPPDQAGPATEAQDWSKTAHRGPKNEPRLPTEAQEIMGRSPTILHGDFEIIGHRKISHNTSRTIRDRKS